MWDVHGSTPPTSGGSHALQRASRSERQQQSRKETLETEALAYEELHDAYAKGVHVRYPLPISPSAEILGQHTKWYATVRAACDRFIDYSICEYRKHSYAWKYLLKNITTELEKQFDATHPVRDGFLASYVSGLITNDRHNWKKHWVKTSGGQHEECPDRAFAVLDKYWSSEEGKNEAERMKHLGSLSGKRQRASSTPPPNPLNQVTLRRNIVLWRKGCWYYKSLVDWHS